MLTRFYLRSNERAYPACVSCGGHADFYHDRSARRAPRADCAICQGFGGEVIDSLPSLTTSRIAGYIILTRLLGLQAPPAAGEIAPEDALVALTMAEESGVTIDPALTTAEGESGADFRLETASEVQTRTALYLEKLRVIATLAFRHREPLRWS